MLNQIWNFTAEDCLSNACHAHLCLLLLSGLACEARQKELEMEKLSSFDDCMEYLME